MDSVGYGLNFWLEFNKVLRKVCINIPITLKEIVFGYTFYDRV